LERSLNIRGFNGWRIAFSVHVTPVVLAGAGGSGKYVSISITVYQRKKEIADFIILAKKGDNKMPMPKPKEGESRDQFISRFMGDSTMNDDFPNQAQRYAVAEKQFDRTKAVPADKEDDDLEENEMTRAPVRTD